MPRQPAPESRPVALTIAGSDSGGGAGVQADLKTMAAVGAFATSAITGVTAQHTRGVESTHVLPVPEIEAQYDAVVSDFDVRAAKTGMLATASIVEAVTGRVADLDAPLVVDPVMVAASGDRLLEAAAENAYEELIAEAALVTPNADEAAVLTGVEPTDDGSAREAARRLRELGADAALVTGGHLPGDEVRDVLATAEGERVISHPRVESAVTHGSGCTVSSAITAFLARGESLEDAVADGIEVAKRAVRYPLDVGDGPGSVHHLAALRNRAARDDAREAVEGIVRGLVEANVRSVVPEVGMNVVVATPYAEAPGETAAIEGRLTRTLDGVAPTRGARMGASSHVARFLLAAREFDPSLRVAVNCRFDAAVEDALDEQGWPAVEIDRRKEPTPDEEGSTMAWAARRAFEKGEGTPVAVYDRGSVGKEAMTRLLARDAATARDRVGALAERV